MNPGICYGCEEPLDQIEHDYATMEVYGSHGGQRFLIYVHRRCKKTFQKVISTGLCANLDHKD